MTLYRERLWPSAWLYISTALVIPASFLILMPVSIPAGIITAIVLYAGCVAALLLSAPVIEVTASEFRAGRARLPLDAAGEVTAHRGDDAQLERGRRLDARAWLLIRGWVSPVVRVEVTDETDPAPYWLVSTRQPDAVIDAFSKARA